MPRVEFQRNVHFLGRNGDGKCAGFHAEPQWSAHGDVVTIAPITSKGEVARCNMQIPIEALDDVIEALKTFKKECG